MHRRRPLTLAAAAFAAATLLAACGGDDSATTSATTVSASESTSVASETTSATSRSTESTNDTTEDSAKNTSGGSVDVGSQQDYIDAAAAGINFADEDLRGCVAEAVVSDDVYAAIQRSGLSVAELKSGNFGGQLEVTADQARAVADDMAACGDLLSEIVEEGKELDCAKANFSNVQIAQGLSFTQFGIELPADLKAAGDKVRACVSGSTSSPSTTT